MDNVVRLLSLYWRYVLDLSVFAVCVVVIGLYQVRLSQRIRLNPALTVQGINSQARAAWVDRVMTENRDIMAVQTLRNSTMAATLMASTAVLLIFGILNLLGNTEKLGPAIGEFNSWGAHEPGMSIFKLMLLIVDFFVAFFAFSLSVRGYHHSGYLLNVPLNGKHGVTPQKVVQVMNRSSKYYSIGMRSYYFSVPLVLWLFGPVWMLLATVALLAILNHLDHVQD